jgi:hypothetical protein
MNIYRIFLIIILGILFSYYSYIFIFADIQSVLAGKPDDSCYYLKIAQNIAEGKGSTFDGIHQTNGYHPLWQLILIPLFILKENPELAYRTMMILQLILLGIAIIVFNIIINKNYNDKISLLGTTLFILFVFLQALNGMESALLIFLINILFYWIFKTNYLLKSKPKLDYTFGSLIILIILTRLDMIFIILGFVLYDLIFFNFVWEYIKKWIRVGSLVGSVLLLYLILNKIYFGVSVPISGVLKSSFPSLTIEGLKTYLSTTKYSPINILIFFIVLIGLFTIVYKKNNKYFNHSFIKSSYMILSITALIQSVCYFVFIKWSLWSWYFLILNLSFVYLSIIGFVFLDQFISFKRVIRYNAIIISILIMFRINNLQDNKLLGSAYKASIWLQNNSSESTVIAMEDCGTVGFFSKRKTINLDGVVNNLDFQNVIKQKKLKEYLMRNNVNFLINQKIYDLNSINDNYKISIQYNSWLFKTKSESIIFSKYQEVFRVYPPNDFSYNNILLIWKL